MGSVLQLEQISQAELLRLQLVKRDGDLGAQLARLSSTLGELLKEQKRGVEEVLRTNVEQRILITEHEEALQKQVRQLGSELREERSQRQAQSAAASKVGGGRGGRGGRGLGTAR